MAFIANKELEKELPSIIGNDFNVENIENASYELLLGDEVYTNNESTKTILTDDEPQFVLNPGQFALLITKEKLNIPPKYLGLISLKFGFKKRGLVNISGFHVDPGFKGKLKFSVYNAGSKSIVLQKGKPYFVLWLSELTSELSKDEEYGKGNEHQNQNEINPDDIMTIQGEIASPNELLSKINSLDSTLNNRIDVVGTEIRTRRERNWWGIRIAVGLLIAIAIRLYWDSNKYEEGYNDAIEKLQTDQRQADNLKDELIQYIDTKYESNKKDSIK
jgi:dCTP deaminase